MSESTAARGTVLISRVFEAPREQVFNAWLDPDEVAGWYGPAQMEAPRERISIDARVGGRWELTMVRRDGKGEMTISYEIVELVEPELLVMRSDPMPEIGMHKGTVVRVELHDQGEKTRMTLSDGPYPGDAGHAEAGWNAALEKLGALVGGASR
ncbi:MAG: SRPBCC domain-containing protein [Actinobacteria bacterium]|nr:SRPBCC domain-containing protein [Actinomycetota bacterium]